jgi:hypothetical protein
MPASARGSEGPLQGLDDDAASAGSSPEPLDSAQSWLARALQARLDQGLDWTITDPLALERIAMLLDIPGGEPGSNAA